MKFGSSNQQHLLYFGTFYSDVKNTLHWASPPLGSHPGLFLPALTGLSVPLLCSWTVFLPSHLHQGTQ